MKKNYLPVLISLFIGPSLFAQSISLDNGKARLVVSLDGGIITELSLGSIDVNVLHDYGHFLCFDRWGPSTKEEKELGIPYLRIETDYSPSDSQRIAVRVEALFETLGAVAPPPKPAKSPVKGPEKTKT